MIEFLSWYQLIAEQIGIRKWRFHSKDIYSGMASLGYCDYCGSHGNMPMVNDNLQWSDNDLIKSGICIYKMFDINSSLLST